MNSSVGLFVVSVRAYQRATLEADRAESAGSEEAVEIAARLRAELARIGPPVTDDQGAI